MEVKDEEEHNDNAQTQTIAVTKGKSNSSVFFFFFEISNNEIVFRWSGKWNESSANENRNQFLR